MYMYIILLVMYKCFVFSFLFPLLKVVFLETFDMCLFWSCWQIFYILIHMYMYIILLVIYKCFVFLFPLLKVVLLETFVMCSFWSCWRIFYILIHSYMYIILLVIYKCFLFSSLAGCPRRNIWYVFVLVLLTNILYMNSYIYVYYTFSYI